MIARDLPGSLQLAFVGDTVYDLFVRERLARGGGRMDDLHRAAVRYVCAAAQSGSTRASASLCAAMSRLRARKVPVVRPL